MSKHFAQLLILIAGILWVSACQRTDIPPREREVRARNLLRFDVSAPLTSLNPASIEASGSTVVLPLLYSYLFVPGEEKRLQPDLATKWSYDSKNLIHTIHLREDALFHDKQPVTAKDVQYSLKEILSKVRPGLWGSVDRISVLSEIAITIRLKKDDPRFLQKIWDSEVIPKPRGNQTDFYNHPIGSGPFRFKDREGEKEVVLEANEGYFQGRPSLDGVIFYFQPDKEKAWTRLLSGETDIVQEISPKNYEMMRQPEKAYHFDLYPLSWYAILLYNTADPLFSDLRVRRALSHAIDREYIVEKILRGFGMVATGPMGVNSPFQTPEMKAMSYNPKKGLRLLEQTGWSLDQTGRHLVKDGKDFEFTLLVFEESQIEKMVAQYIKLCMNDLGVKVHLKLLPFLELTRRYAGNSDFDAVLTEFSGVYRDPEFLKSLWCPNGLERARSGSLEAPALCRLIGQAVDETDPERQRNLFCQVEAMIRHIQPGAFLFHKTAIDVMSKRFQLTHPFSLTQEGIWRLKFASLRSS